MPTSKTMTPLQARARLLEGNRRFASSRPLHPRQTLERRGQIVERQRPFAVVLSCADSRVPPEILFDQGLGDLFVIRTAGAVVDNAVLGSLEFAVGILGLRLVLVLGHTRCGAVQAALESIQKPTIPQPPHLSDLLQALRPAVEAALPAADPAREALTASIQLAVEQIKACEPLLAAAVRAADLDVTGGIYHLESGKVEFLAA